MIKRINYSTKYKQEGLVVSLKDDKITITKGKLIYDKVFELEQNVSFKIDEKAVIILLVEDIETGEVLVAASDGGIDKTKYRLIERLSWKNESGWNYLSVEPYPKPSKAGEYNYEGFNKKDIQKSLEIHPRRRKTIGPDGRVFIKDIKNTIIKRKG